MYISLVHKPFSLWETFHPSESTIFKVRLWHEETMIRSRCWVDFPWGITHYRYLFLIKFPHSYYYSYLFPEFHKATKALMRRKRNLNKYMLWYISSKNATKHPVAKCLDVFSLIFSSLKMKLFQTLWCIYSYNFKYFLKRLFPSNISKKYLQIHQNMFNNFHLQTTENLADSQNCHAEFKATVQQNTRVISSVIRIKSR